MNLEIERKYLVKSDSFKDEAQKSYRITQGFLNKDPQRTVRVRVSNHSGKLTVKGKSSEDGLSRFEWETLLSEEDAQELLLLCEPGLIEKTRYEIPYQGLLIEVDVFHEENEGLILAEIELPAMDTPLNTPAWIGTEVTGDPRYYNSYLSKTPYKVWPKKNGEI